MPTNIKVTDNESITDISVGLGIFVITAKNKIEAEKIFDVLGTIIKWSWRDGGKNKMSFAITSCELLRNNLGNDSKFFTKPALIITEDLKNKIDSLKEIINDKPYKKLIITGDLKQAAEYLKEFVKNGDIYNKIIEAINTENIQKVEESKEKKFTNT